MAVISDFSVQLVDEGDEVDILNNIENIQFGTVTTSHSLNVDENIDVNYLVYTAIPSDNLVTPNSYTLSGNDASLLNVNENGEVRFNVSPDFEAKDNYNFEILVSDGLYNEMQNISININDIIDADGFNLGSGHNHIDLNVTGSNTLTGLFDGGDGYDSLNLIGRADLTTQNFSSAGSIPFNPSENGTIIELNSSDVTGVNAGLYHIFTPDWITNNYNNHNLNSQPSHTDVIILKPVTLDLSTTSDLTDYTPLGVSTILLSYDQKIELATGNGSSSENNFVITNAHLSTGGNLSNYYTGIHIEKNGVLIDFTAGIQDELNSAFVTSFGGENGAVGFEINNFEKLSLTDQADFAIITEHVGLGVQNIDDAYYFTTSQSTMTIDPGGSGSGVDLLRVNSDSQIKLSYYDSFDYDSGNGSGVDVYLDDTSVSVSGNTISTEILKTGGTGLIVDSLETTGTSDYVDNYDSSLGVVVDLGGSYDDADTFVGSNNAAAIDVLDARYANQLEFEKLSSSIKVTGDNELNNSSIVNAELSDVEIIMVRDQELTGLSGTDHDQISDEFSTADVDFYVDLSDVYGQQQINGLGEGTVDTYGEGYDVQTSAQVNVFGDKENVRVYYDGKHSDFKDTGDVIDTSIEGKWKMINGDTSNGSTWADEVAASNPNGGEGSFFIVVNGKKIAVKHADGEWKADNSSLSIAQNVSSETIAKNLGVMSEQQFIASIADRYGLPELSDLMDYSYSNAIYLNATEQQINEVLGSDGSLTSEKAFNFGFYTKVNIGDAVVNLKISQSDADPQQFNLNWDDVDLMVESFYNRVETVGEGVSAGGKAANFVKVDNAKDIAMGNGGDDTYVIGSNNAGGKVAGGTALEYGDVSSTGGLLNSEGDSVNFAGIDSITELDFVRGKDRNERADSSLFISEKNGSDATVLFDNYNEYLDFRRIEFLTIDDAGNNNEIFEISVDGNGGTDDTGKDLAWDNEIVIADNQGDTIYADGGTDILVGGQGDDTFDLRNVLDGTVADTSSSHVYIKNISGSDNIITNAGDDFSGNTDLTDGVIDVQTSSGGVYHLYTDDEDTLMNYLEAQSL
ncbi:MAG: cadherin repeat domain-containing protein [Alphaproteobacteria bacterium]|nr:MAG: cadherin repeat domain-containing protein [Alphaproteobacteria bacterium]